MFVILFLMVFSVTAATPQDSLMIKPANPIQGEPSVYTLSFVTVDTLFPDGIIEITLTEDFDLSKTRLANSTTINGGFTVAVNGNTVVLQRKGTGRLVLPLEKVDVQFGVVKNPQKLQVDFPLRMTVKNATRPDKHAIHQQKVVFAEKRNEEN